LESFPTIRKDHPNIKIILNFKKGKDQAFSPRRFLDSHTNLSTITDSSFQGIQGRETLSGFQDSVIIFFPDNRCLLAYFCVTKTGQSSDSSLKKSSSKCLVLSIHRYKSY
jgi:hypothetical protein